MGSHLRYQNQPIRLHPDYRAGSPEYKTKAEQKRELRARRRREANGEPLTPAKPPRCRVCKSPTVKAAWAANHGMCPLCVVRSGGTPEGAIK